MLLLLLLSGCAGGNKNTATNNLPFYNSASFTAEWIAPGDTAYTHIHQIDSFALLNQQGHIFTGDSLNGKIYLANFFFTSCPSICPKMMHNLKRVQDSFPTQPDVQLVSFSVMPWIDSVGRLNSYANANGINNAQWHLLTGNTERIYRLGRQSYFAEKTLGTKKAADEFLHTESMLLIDRQARIRGIYNATQAVDIDRAIEDIRLLYHE